MRSDGLRRIEIEAPTKAREASITSFQAAQGRLRNTPTTVVVWTKPVNNSWRRSNCHHDIRGRDPALMASIFQSRRALWVQLLLACRTADCLSDRPRAALLRVRGGQWGDGSPQPPQQPNRFYGQPPPEPYGATDPRSPASYDQPPPLANPYDATGPPPQHSPYGQQPAPHGGGAYGQPQAAPMPQQAPPQGYAPYGAQPGGAPPYGAPAAPYQ